MPTDQDIAVVGAGCVGLSAAFALRAARANVSVYERGRPGGGQSAGSSRILRLNHLDERMIPFVVRANEIFGRWEGKFHEELLGRGGVLVTGPTAQERRQKLVAEGVDVTPASPHSHADILPIARGWTTDEAFVEPGAAIWTERTIRALADDLTASLVRETVLAVRPMGTAVEVFTEGGVREHARVIVAAGAGTAPLASPLGIQLPLQRTLHLRGAFRIREPRGHVVPCLQDSTGEYGPGVYAAPDPTGQLYAVGLSGREGELGAGEGLDETIAVRQRTEEYVRAALPGLDPTAVDWTVCPVTRLPWGSDAVGCWIHGHVAIVAGHNLWKWAPALGAELSRWATDGHLEPLLRPETRLGSHEE